jgi:hypothetical protein
MHSPWTFSHIASNIVNSFPSNHVCLHSPLRIRNCYPYIYEITDNIIINLSVFFGVVPCCLVDTDQRSRFSYCQHHQGEDNGGIKYMIICVSRILPVMSVNNSKDKRFWTELCKQLLRCSTVKSLYSSITIMLLTLRAHKSGSAKYFGLQLSLQI